MGGPIWLVTNPAAGAGRASRHAAAAVAAFRAAGVDCQVVTPASAAETTAAARAGVVAGAAAVVACGGDGTVHAVLQGLADTTVPLGILASGSGDDIASGLGYPTRDVAEEAAAVVRAVTSGTTRAVDVGRARTADGLERWFLGVLTTGFDSSVNERANRMSRLGGQRYNIAMVRELASFRPLAYTVAIDGQEITSPGTLVTIGNGPQYGGGMRICPVAQLDDGLLDVTWLGAVSRVTLLRVFPSVYSGTHVDHPAVRTFRGRTLRVEAPGQIAYADGERLGPLPVDVEVRPGALRVLSG